MIGDEIIFESTTFETGYEVGAKNNNRYTVIIK